MSQVRVLLGEPSSLKEATMKRRWKQAAFFSWAGVRRVVRGSKLSEPEHFVDPGSGQPNLYGLCSLLLLVSAVRAFERRSEGAFCARSRAGQLLKETAREIVHAVG